MQDHKKSSDTRAVKGSLPARHRLTPVPAPQRSSAIARTVNVAHGPTAANTILGNRQLLQARPAVPAENGRPHWPPPFRPESRPQPLQPKMAAPPVYRPRLAQSSTQVQPLKPWQQGPPVYRVPSQESTRSVVSPTMKNGVFTAPGARPGPLKFQTLVQRAPAPNQRLALPPRVNSIVQRMESTSLLSSTSSGSSTDYLSKEEADKKYKEGNTTVSIDQTIDGLWKRISPWGWIRTPGGPSTSSPRVLATYTNTAGDTITVTTDIGFDGDGKVYANYVGHNGLRGGGWISFTTETSTTAQQGYMKTDDAIQGKGIGTIVSYEGALLLKGIGIKTVKAMANKNSIGILRAAQSGSSGSSSWCSCLPCFLTTACVQARDLPDDCAELTVLRGFRDGYLSENAERKSMVAEYYEIAPEIVEAIQATPDSRREFESIYETISLCVRLIRGEQFEQALEAYRAMVQSLRQKYLVESNA
jgi:hypothetical protein